MVTKDYFKRKLDKILKNPFFILWGCLCILQGIITFLDPPPIYVASNEPKIGMVYIFYQLLFWVVWTMKLILPTLLLSLLPTYFFCGVFLSIIGSGQFAIVLMPFAAMVVELQLKKYDWLFLSINFFYVIGILLLQLLLLLLFRDLSYSYKYRLQYNHKEKFFVNWYRALLKETLSSEMRPLLFVYVFLLSLKLLFIIFFA